MSNVIRPESEVPPPFHDEPTQPGFPPPDARDAMVGEIAGAVAGYLQVPLDNILQELKSIRRDNEQIRDRVADLERSVNQIQLRCGERHDQMLGQ